MEAPGEPCEPRGTNVPGKPDETLGTIPVHAVPLAHRESVPVRAAVSAPMPHYSEKKLKLHNWLAGDRCSDGSPAG